MIEKIHTPCPSCGRNEDGCWETPCPSDDCPSKSQTPTKPVKRYRTRENVGRAKYTVSKHDGKTFHKDGSDFFDIAIFSNKKKRDAYVNQLKAEGYPRA